MMLAIFWRLAAFEVKARRHLAMLAMAARHRTRVRSEIPGAAQDGGQLQLTWLRLTNTHLLFVQIWDMKTKLMVLKGN